MDPDSVMTDCEVETQGLCGCCDKILRAQSESISALCPVVGEPKPDKIEYEYGQGLMHLLRTQLDEIFTNARFIQEQAECIHFDLAK